MGRGSAEPRISQPVTASRTTAVISMMSTVFDRPEENPSLNPKMPIVRARMKPPDGAGHRYVIRFRHQQRSTDRSFMPVPGPNPAGFDSTAAQRRGPASEG